MADRQLWTQRALRILAHLARKVRTLERTVAKYKWGYPISNVRLVKVSQDGGSAGSASTTCSFTYTVTTPTGDTLATGVSPEHARLTNTIYLAAGTGGRSPYALAAKDENGTLRLMHVPGERPDNTACT